jgi:2,4-dienoyl-CoA reductase-like NADH-dependent reductase (Old Yellow Enzyme family)
MRMMTIFAPFKMANLILNNRLVMAPMTRSKALPGGTPAATVFPKSQYRTHPYRRYSTL